MKALKDSPVALGAVVVLLLAIAWVGYYLLTKPPQSELPPAATPPVEQLAPEVAPPVEQSAPKVTPSTEPSPLSFSQKIDNLWQEVEEVRVTGEGREVTLVFTEAEINSEIPRLLTKANLREAVPLDIKSAQLDFHPDDAITVLTTVDTYGITLDVEVETRVGIEAGKPRITIVDIHLGKIFLPTFIKNYVINTISDAVE